MAIGAVVALVAFTGGAALGVALAAGAVVAGVGSAAAVATYMHDKENSLFRRHIYKKLRDGIAYNSNGDWELLGSTLCGRCSSP